MKCDSNLRQLGKSELLVSPVAFGSWPIAGMTSLEVNDTDSLATIHSALESGINFIDTAHCYGQHGESELLIGRAINDLTKNHQRDEIIIASKGGIHWDSQGVRHYEASPEKIIQECEESLRRMQLETIDLLYLHAPDPKIPVEDSATAFAKLIESGKIRTAGVSNLDVQQMATFDSVCPITAAQPPYNMLQRDIEADVIPWCQHRSISVINYWPLMKGLLAGKIRRGHEFDPKDKRLTYEVFQGENFEAAQLLLDELDEIADSIGKSVAQVVINWTIHRPGITSTLCGAKRSWQIEETAQAMKWELDEPSLQRIDALLDRLPND
jgi:aryl-alcohol dehydrogenase-like predicted oxidoreductase